MESCPKKKQILISKGIKRKARVGWFRRVRSGVRWNRFVRKSGEEGSTQGMKRKMINKDEEGRVLFFKKKKKKINPNQSEPPQQPLRDLYLAEPLV